MRVLLTVLMLGSAAAASASLAQVPAAPPVPQPAATPRASGRIAGQVVDASSGQPLPAVQVQVVGTTIGSMTDLDGRFRTGAIPVGTHAIVARRIGFAPVRQENVIVAADRATVLTLAMSASAVTLGAVQVTEQAPAKASSEAGLLAVQQRAAAVSDGVSAEQIRRSPDSDAGEAVKRVTGVSVVDDKFVIVRGLTERYSNTLLNGVELASPEPLKKLVPLDVFPASLMEAIVTTKTATPDRPGDFAGGSVELRTKDFPENTVLQANLSTGFNSQSTFRSFPHPPRAGSDWFAIDGGRRALPAGAPALGAPATEAFAERLRNVWTPRRAPGRPTLGAGLNVGGQRDVLGNPLGFVLSGTYGTKEEFVPDRLNQYSAAATLVPARGFRISEHSFVTDLGGTANLAYRLGTGTKIGFRNLYTRNATEVVTQAEGFVNTNQRVERRHQLRYAERGFLQSQLAGDHLLGFLWNSRLEWKGTISRARWAEPENREAVYEGAIGASTLGLAQTPAKLEYRSMSDRVDGAQADYTFPISLHGPADGALKFGGMLRRKSRDFAADQLRYFFPVRSDLIATLPPEQAFAPEHMGDWFQVTRVNDLSQRPHEIRDRVLAYYGMLDVPVFTWLRVVGGVRMEAWDLDVRLLSRGSDVDPGTTQQERDPLWSTNVTFRITDRMNFRLAGYRTVSRPDARELSPDCYQPTTGGELYCGTPNLRRATIMNADLRWEWFPRAGELFSVSLFGKRFTDPIVEYVSLAQSGLTQISFTNAADADAAGVELEARRGLDFLPWVFRNLSASANVTITDTRVGFDSLAGNFPDDLQLQGQSPLLVNAGLSYGDERGISLSVLANYFADRISRYGLAFSVGEGEAPPKGPDLEERGRVTLDGKAQVRIGPTTVSLAGRNLLDAETVLFQQVEDRRAIAGAWRSGRVITLGVGHDF